MAMISRREKLKIGVALGGGAAKGIAHIGVLAELEKHGIQPDMVAGTSMGALVGAVYARGESPERMKAIGREFGQKRFGLFADPGLPRSGLIRGRKISDLLRSIIGEVEFSDLKVPFACVATDIGNGQEVVIDQGLVWHGVRASCSIPVLLPPVKSGNRYLVDGGLVSPIPVKVLRDMGADIVIAVNVSQKSQDDAYWGNQAGPSKEPNIFNIAFQTINLIGCQASKNCLSGADIVIEPRVGHINWGDFRRIDECIEAGELAVQESMPRILSLVEN